MMNSCEPIHSIEYIFHGKVDNGSLRLLFTHCVCMVVHYILYMLKNTLSYRNSRNVCWSDHLCSKTILLIIQYIYFQLKENR